MTGKVPTPQLIPVKTPPTMPTTTIAGHEVEVNEEGILTQPDQWSEDLAPELATASSASTRSPTRTGHSSASCATTTRSGTRPPPLRRVSTRSGARQEIFTSSRASRRRRSAYVSGLPKARKVRVTMTMSTFPSSPNFDACRGGAASSPSSAPTATSTHGLSWPHPRQCCFGEGVETHLFFTFWGFDIIINKATMADLSSPSSATRRCTCPVTPGWGPPTCSVPCRAYLADRHRPFEEADRRPRRPRVPEFLELLSRFGCHVGLPDERGHEPPDRWTTSSRVSRIIISAK